jgi:hypothetical protein
MIPDENGEKVQQYQRTALDGVGFGNLLATNQPRDAGRQRQAALSPRRAVGSQLGCCTARLGGARVIEII